MKTNGEVNTISADVPLYKTLGSLGGEKLRGSGKSTSTGWLW